MSQKTTVLVSQGPCRPFHTGLLQQHVTTEATGKNKVSPLIWKEGGNFLLVLNNSRINLNYSVTAEKKHKQM